MIYQAHRGVSTEYPENTMLAFRAAYEQGYQIIELDPAFTVDDQCVLFHDKKVGRVCPAAPDPERLVAEMTYAELAVLDVGLYMGEQFRGTVAPLLEEVLAFAAEKIAEIPQTLPQQTTEYQLLDVLPPHLFYPGNSYPLS